MQEIQLGRYCRLKVIGVRSRVAIVEVGLGGLELFNESYQ